MKHIVIIVLAATLLGACRKHHEDTEPLPELSVLVYMAAENNLDSYTMGDIKQMMVGSKSLSDKCNLLLFLDRRGKNPQLIRVAKGDTTCVKTYTENLRSSDAATLRMAMEWMMENCKAKSYGLVLWGHASGWIIEDKGTTASRRRAYGQEIQGSLTWMDIPDMARALESLPKEGTQKPLKFIFADCCCFQSVESAYELRQCADVIIASAAEIPGEGAPYQTVIPALFSQTEDYYKKAIDAYYAQESGGYREPMSAVMTSRMDDLAQATRTVLSQHVPNLATDGYPKVDSLIYYYCHSLFDMNDFILRYSSDSDYRQWRQAFDQAVPYSTMTLVWMANWVPYLDPLTEQTFRDFDITAERYGGVNMFVPQDPASVSSNYRDVVDGQNKHISRMQWYKAAGLDKLGW